MAGSVEWATRGWSETCRKCFSFYGWTVTEPWKWKHDDFNLRFSFASGKILPKARLEHIWREAFRQWHFRRWLNKGRRDSRVCFAAGTAYHEACCAIAMCWALDCRQSFMVLNGSTFSPAVLDVAKSREVQPRSFCAHLDFSEDARPKPTLKHLLWECEGLADDRQATLCGARPASQLQERLGWPSTADRSADERIRAWHLMVRSKILHERYG